MEKFVSSLLLSFFPFGWPGIMNTSLCNTAQYNTYFTISEVLSFVHANKALGKASGLYKKKKHKMYGQIREETDTS